MTGDDSRRDDGDGGELAVISALIAGIAHDLNNLLMVMGSCAHFLEGSPGLGDTGRGDAALLNEAVQRAAALTTRLSAFGRRSALRVVDLDVGGVVAELDNVLRRMAGEDIDVQINAPRGLMVTADRVRLEQLVLSAGLSARRLLPRGGTLMIDVVGVQDTVVLSVTVVPRDGSPDAAGPYPALGLAGEIAGEAGGALAVEPLPDRGVRLRVSLPLLRGERPIGLARARGGTETVLLVEDDDSTRSILARVLTSAGYLVLSAGAVADAVRIVEDHRQPIALLLTDVVLPDGSGMDVVDRMASKHPAVRVILASGYPDTVLDGYGVPARGVSRLAKPFTTTELLDAVRAAIDRR